MLKAEKFFVPAVFTALLLAVGGCADLFGPDALSCSGGIDLRVGDSVSGTLQSGDQQDIDGAWLDSYTLGVEEESNVTIDMRSTEVDSWLWLLSASGGVITADDDGGDGVNARITRNLDRGCYTVEATTFAAGETGSYTLQVSGS